MKKLLFILVFITAFSFGQVVLEEGLQKEIVVEGNVTDVNGMPLTDVSFLVNGKSNGVSTNFDGYFTLKAIEGAVLVVSCSGFKTKEIALENQIKINITMEDEVKSENKKPLTKEEIRKNKRYTRRNKRDSQKAKYSEPLDLKEEMLKGVGRSIKGAIRKKNNL